MKAVNAPISQKRNPPFAKEYQSISSLLKKPDKGGMPEIASAAIKNVPAVFGICFLSPP